MTKTSRWAGYCASVFAITFFVSVTIYRGGVLPGWFAVVTGWCMMLAAFSGVVCLVSGVFGYFRSRRQDIKIGREILDDEKPSA
jgi:hypothetical protein